MLSGCLSIDVHYAIVLWRLCCLVRGCDIALSVGCYAHVCMYVCMMHDRYQSVVMVGDGATDMQAKGAGAADAFVGFGGVVVRR